MRLKRVSRAAYSLLDNGDKKNKGQGKSEGMKNRQCGWNPQGRRPSRYSQCYMNP